jgi:Nuclease-related domain
MARMYPEKLVSHIKSTTGQRLYYVLKERLPEEYTVICNVPLTTSLRGGGKRDKEIDFLVLHPQRGVLNLEVKGGEIKYDRNLNQWISIDHFGVPHKIHPYEQATACMHILIDRLQRKTNSPLLENASRHCTFARGVIFPEEILDKQIHTKVYRKSRHKNRGY